MENSDLFFIFYFLEVVEQHSRTQILASRIEKHSGN